MCVWIHSFLRHWSHLYSSNARKEIAVKLPSFHWMQPHIKSPDTIFYLTKPPGPAEKSQHLRFPKLLLRDGTLRYKTSVSTRKVCHNWSMTHFCPFCSCKRYKVWWSFITYAEYQILVASSCANFCDSSTNTNGRAMTMKFFINIFCWFIFEMVSWTVTTIHLRCIVANGLFLSTFQALKSEFQWTHHALQAQQPLCV